VNHKRELKVFVGPNNNVGLNVKIADALKAVNVYAKSCSFNEDPYIYNKADIVIPLWGHKKYNYFQKLFINKISRFFINSVIRIYILLYALLKFDIIYLISPHTFFKKNLDLPILKLFKKKIVFAFLGCAERDPSDPINHSKYGICKLCNDRRKQKNVYCTNLNKKQKRIRYLEKYADHIFAVKDLSSFLIYKNYHQIFVPHSKPPAIDYLSKFNRRPIVIAHFPTNNSLKGTKYVLQAMEKISDKYANEVKFICEKVENKKLLGLLEKEVCILIDQFGSYHGMLAVEAMSRGTVVVARISDWFYEERQELPVVNCEANEIFEKLSELIENPSKLKILAQQSIEYYYKYHSLNSVGAKFKDVIFS